ncbi:MAG: TonB-dependent receptor, partial [Hymenobacteraceae bacterium]|nr:TonB-dependent receptor [Hymenobacteraceae bacterium]MDX5396171.1 TonB-dependent receptor [Hymenobacteraceae bacterium]MDX5512232.1 TonB-dependent receptor [Hymenobacteraceae bacterium]
MKITHLPLVVLLLTGAQQVAAQQTGAAQQAPKMAIPGTAAPKGNGKISGTVTDAGTGKPVEFATVSLIPAGSTQPVDGAMCDEKGRFTISKIATGDYRLNISFIGYEAQVKEKISITDGNESVDLGTIQLKPDVKTLQEVEVVGEKLLIEDRVDRMVYNAEKDATTAGTSAAEVLQKVPMVTVDLDGNVQLRGSSNVRVLINNKPSTIMAASVADALRQIPADMIKTVEVITSPSAKYDAEGTAGIINIITKKNTLQGVNGNVNSSLGTRYSNLFLSTNMRRNNFGINANVGGNFFNNKGYSRYTRTDFVSADARNLTYQQSDYHNFNVFNYGQIGFDYDINKKITINGSVRMHLGNMRNDNQLAS